MKNTDMNEFSKRWLAFDEFIDKFEKEKVEEYPNDVLSLMPQPIVSVRMHMYQHAGFVREAIDSVLMQKTNFPFEIVIGDDDSDDGTKEICIEYARKHPGKIRLFLHKKANRIHILGKQCGIFSIAYNLYKSRGKYLAGCAGDDFWTDPDKLQKQIDFMDSHPEISYTYHDWRFLHMDTDGKSGTPGEIVVQDRSQSMVFHHIFNRIPVEFLSVFQDDVFVKFNLRIHGRGHYIGDILPAVCRIHENNMWGVSNDSKKFVMQADQRQNTWKQIAKAFKGSRYEKEAEKQRIIFYIFNVLQHPELNLFQKFSHLFLRTFLYLHTINYLGLIFRDLKSNNDKYQ